MSQEVYMDVPAVRGIARSFGQIEDVLRAASRSMEVAITTLKTTAFIGLVGGFAVSFFLEQIKPVFDNYAAKCNEM
jgi:ABC-type spermidine/putrescine transport system permease subunit II